MKTVHVIGHRFDAVPAHVTVAARGSGGSLRVAVARAVSMMLSDRRLKHKQIGEFKISVAVIADRPSIADRIDPI